MTANLAVLSALSCVGPKSGHSDSRSCKAAVVALAGAVFLSGAQVLFQVIWSWQNPVPCGCRTEFPPSSSAVSSQSLTLPCHMLPLSYKEGKLCCISLPRLKPLSLGRALSLFRSYLIKFGSSCKANYAI